VRGAFGSTSYLPARIPTVCWKTGKQIDHIDVAKPWTTNATFGGKERDLLFITVTRNVYRLKLRVNGAQ
jgi:gluconolactonase